MAKRKKQRPHKAAAKSRADVMQHIELLGLKTIEEYKSWCREHGFSAVLNKRWAERREERLAATKAREVSAAKEDLMQHIKALGLDTVEAYQAWCVKHRFSLGLNKGKRQRGQEIAAAKSEQAELALATVRRQTRKPTDTIRRLYRGEIEAEELRTPYLQKIHDLFISIEEKPDVRETFLQLLLRTEKHTDFFSIAPVIPEFDRREGNTYIEGLLTLAYYHQSWMRPPKSWKPKSHNSRRKFGSLARHLLAKYDVPAFMAAAWFSRTAPQAPQHHGWFKHIGAGRNIRKADLPLQFTKRMAHVFAQAPGDYLIEDALRWAQVVGLGGSDHLAQAVIETRLGRSFENEEFWVGVVKFLVYTPMLDPAYVEPIVEYIHHQKYVPEEIVGPDGVVEYGDAPNPGFSMVGRTIDSLIRQADEWRGQLAQEAQILGKAVRGRWPASGVHELEYTEDDKQDGGTTRWTIREMLTRKALFAEGKAMSHCAATYVESCRKGQTSIWSLGIEPPNDSTKRRRVITIAVKNNTRAITQARGRSNAAPVGKHQSKEHQRRLRQGNRIMHMWARQEDLSASRHI